MTGPRDVEVPRWSRRRPSPTQAAKELLGLVGMADRLNHLPNQLSGGNASGVAAARALANDPPLVLADEPTVTWILWQVMDLLSCCTTDHSQGTTFLIVTHDPACRPPDAPGDRHGRWSDRPRGCDRSPLEEDLKMWRHSGLGRRIVSEVKSKRSIS